MKSVQMKLFIMVLALSAAAMAPDFLSEYATRLLTLSVISAVAVIGLNIAFGYAGLISLGHAAFVGLGAYSAALLTTRFNMNVWVACIAAVVIATAVAYLLGRILLRLKGHYLALATLGINVSFTIVTSNWVELAGGTDGISGIPALTVFGHAIHTEQEFYWLALIVLLVVSIITWRIRVSHLGRTFMAVRDDELASLMTGVSVPKAKTCAFAFSAAYAALAGCLFAFHVHFISPEDFAYGHSITYLAMLIVGGEGSIVGSIIGATVITMLPEVLRGVGSAYLLFFGLLVLVVLIVLPKGIVSLPAKFSQLRWKLKSSKTAVRHL